MMVEKEDLGLSLSLSFPHEKRTATLITNGSSGSSNPLQLNLMPSLTADHPSPFAHLLHHKTSWTTHQTFPSSSPGLVCLFVFFFSVILEDLIKYLFFTTLVFNKSLLQIETWRHAEWRQGLF